VQYDYKNEVWLEQLELPRFVKLGEDYEASIVLSSLQAGSGKLVLRENGKVIAENEVKFAAGKNRYVVPIKLREAGYYEYAATIEVPNGPNGEKLDNQSQNNTVLNYIYVEGEGKVLLVTNPQGDDRDYQAFAQALRESERAVEIKDAYSMPDDSLSLL